MAFKLFMKSKTSLVTFYLNDHLYNRVRKIAVHITMLVFVRHLDKLTADANRQFEQHTFTLLVLNGCQVWLAKVNAQWKTCIGQTIAIGKINTEQENKSFFNYLRILQKKLYLPMKGNTFISSSTFLVIVFTVNYRATSHYVSRMNESRHVHADCGRSRNELRVEHLIHLVTIFPREVHTFAASS